jgi:hypothetical protein
MATLEVAPNTRVRFDRRAIATKVDTSGRPLTGPNAARTPIERPVDGPSDGRSTDPEK